MDELRSEGNMLEIGELSVYYGGIRALNNVSLRVARGEIVAVIGANGAGKSTLLRSIAGVTPFASGWIRLEGKEMPRQAFRVVSQGIMLVPEGRKIFAPLTVKENLMLGAYTRSNAHEINQTLETVFALFPVLKERIGQRGGTLSGGEQQMLAVGRALMGQPRMLLLDEPSLGLAPIVVDTLFQKIVQLNRETGLTMLLVEQNASLALEIAQRAYVLETGEIKIEGAGKALLDDRRIKESYLGITSAHGL